MDISPQGLARNWAPNIPSILKTSALSVVGRSRNSQHQDTLTETIVASARPILQTPAPLLRSQQNCNADWGIGRPWIAKYTIPKPKAGKILEVDQQADSEPQTLRQAVRYAIILLSKAEHRESALACPIPDLIDVETEWTFYRAHTLPVSPMPDSSEREIYSRFMQDVDADGPTILHFHGGAYCLMDPATHRWTLTSLAQRAGGRVLSVRYRLSPQNVFPAALLDALQAYLSLIAPPPDAFHSPISSSKIVISGDSSGGGLGSALLLLLLTLSKQNVTLEFHGKAVKIPSPPCAGLALASPWLDITRSLPSTIENSRYDIIAPPPLDSATPPFPADAIWPTSPPRAETFTTASMVTHPLVSPLAATVQQWHGAPPVYICCGWEGFTDEIEVFARKLHLSSAESKVIFEGWEGMPHCFMMMPWNRAGRDALNNWGMFCHDFVKDGKPVSRKQALWTNSLTYKQSEVPLSELGLRREGSGYTREQALTDDRVDELMEKGRAWRLELEEQLLRAWKDDMMQRLPN